jgi:hypothetical protein
MAAPILQKLNQAPIGEVSRNQHLGKIADANAFENGV